MIGVPTLYEAMNKDPNFQNKTDLSCLRGAFCGADTLPRVVKERFEEIAKKSGNEELILREGYGLTETVTAIAAMPMNEYREGSIGIPFPDVLIKIVKLDENGESTTQEAPVGEEGEICVAGPDVMMGYLDNPEETNKVLKKHDDGRTWVHTGDIASMDEDGFFYFKLRKKRMIKSSGFNVYPVQVEAVLNEHPEVANSCVIGVPDKDQVERVKGYVVLEDPEKESKEMEKQLIGYCREKLLKWKCPREIAFAKELPTTLVGKVAYKVLEDREKERLRKEGKYAGD
jgi:long-chain acyl-CoA synthetase